MTNFRTQSVIKYYDFMHSTWKRNNHLILARILTGANYTDLHQQSISFKKLDILSEEVLDPMFF